MVIFTILEGNVYLNWRDELSLATCLARSHAGWHWSVRRDCGGGQSCDTICAMNYTQQNVNLYSSIRYNRGVKSRAYLRGGSGGSNPPRNFQFFFEK